MSQVHLPSGTVVDQKVCIGISVNVRSLAAVLILGEESELIGTQPVDIGSCWSESLINLLQDNSRLKGAHAVRRAVRHAHTGVTSP